MLSGAFDTDECLLLQSEEYQVLESIYPECISSSITNSSLKLEIPVEFNEPRAIYLVRDDVLVDSGVNSPDTHLTLSLSSLPPLLITVALPPSYPMDSPPHLTSIRSTHLWLPHTLDLQKVLTQMWQRGEGVLCTWVEFIRSGDFLNALFPLYLTEKGVVRISHSSPRVLAKLLKDSETALKSLQFAQNSYPCSICLTSLKGSKCIQLKCSHIFCRSCLEDFWKLCIAEGEVGRVGCPDPECVKSSREADAEEVGRIVTEAELRRWQWLREKRDLEKDPSIVHCPMDFCQAPVSKPEGIDETSGYDRLRSCPACSFSFCAFCRRTWHGPITTCPIEHSEKLVLEYLSSPEDGLERELIERMFGKANVLKLVTKYNEDQANRIWLEASTMACPGCKLHVEKSSGCNHMTCSKCGKHFCYRCGAKLPAGDPLKHFSIPGGGCYQKLFDFQEVDEEL